MSSTRWLLFSMLLVACSTAPKEPLTGDATPPWGDGHTGEWGYPGQWESLPFHSKWTPAEASWAPGDLHHRACQQAAKLGCIEAGDVGSCATTLAKQNGKLWEMRMETVVEARTKQHVADSTVIPCDAGSEQ
jgi:hypothetical protein